MHNDDDITCTNESKSKVMEEPQNIVDSNNLNTFADFTISQSSFNTKETDMLTLKSKFANGNISESILQNDIIANDELSLLEFDSSNIESNVLIENQHEIPSVCMNTVKDSSEINNSINCNTDTLTKDLCNSTDLKQNAFYDKEALSNEICQNLNHILSENCSSDLPNDLVVSVNGIDNQLKVSSSNSQSNSPVGSEAVVCSTADDVSATFAQNAEGFINLQELCGENGAENVGSILLIQDESGNVETMYLIQDSAENGQYVFANGVTNDMLTSQDFSNLEITTDDGINRLQQIILAANNEVGDQTISISNGDIIINSEVDNIPSISNESMNADSMETDKETLVNDLFEKTGNDLSNTLSTTDALGTNISNQIQNISEKSLAQSVENVQNAEDNSLLKDINSEQVLSMQIELNDNLVSDSISKISDTCELNIISDFSNAEQTGDTSTNLKPKVIYSTHENSNKNQPNEVLEINNTDICESSVASVSESKSLSVPNSDKDITNNKIETPRTESKTNKELAENNLDPNNTCELPITVAELEKNKILDFDPDIIITGEYFNNHPLNSTTSLTGPIKRSAKKSLPHSTVNIPKGCLEQIHGSPLNLNGRFKNVALKKRSMNCEVYNHKRPKFETKRSNGVLKDSHGVALKTFKKPFTAAKKSVVDSGDPTQFRRTALKTFSKRPHLSQKAVKSCTKKLGTDKPNESALIANAIPKIFLNVDKEKRNLQPDLDSKFYFQPEVCEIRILPNEYVKKATTLLQTTKSYESFSNCEDNVSDEEIRLSSGTCSPLKEFLEQSNSCLCSSRETPCVSNDGRLQLTCEAQDSINGVVTECKNPVTRHCLFSPSANISYRAFCDVHLERFHKHHCCPKCGTFCSEGKFTMCTPEGVENPENHFFHIDCYLLPGPGLPPACPHCCKFSYFNTITLRFKANLENPDSFAECTNITEELNGCDIMMTVEKNTKETLTDFSAHAPDKDKMHLMIMALAKEKNLRLRPTGKCLYNPVKIGDVQKVMQLIANGVNPNHKFRMHSNNASIHVASYYGSVTMVHVLLQTGAFIDAVNDDLETPLIVAVERNQLPVVRYLIFAGAQIDVKDCNGMTAFHIASKNGFREIAEFLYETGMIDINLQDDGGWTALVWACEHKHTEFVKWLLEIGADPNVRDNEENTVLHWAAYSGKGDIAELLLNKGCNLSYVNKRGDSALHIAAREDNVECAKLFISRGAIVDQKNKDNKIPLMCCQDDSESWRFLCQYVSPGASLAKKVLSENHVVFRDISRGAESYPIQAVNEVDDEEFIMEFRYVVKNCHRSGVNIISTVDSMQFCYCKDNCLTPDCTCIMISKCWYDGNCCLTAEYDLTNLPAIFECSKTCHCPKTCVNRVVQRGLRYPLQLFRTKYQGWGVRALQDLPKGAFVCEYVGELITGQEASQREDDTYLFDLESVNADYCLDGRYYGNVARFLNHSCEPNMSAIKVFVDHQDLNFPRIAFFTLREVKAYEELCFDYGTDFWAVKSHTTLCTCKSPLCKYSKDTIDETLQKYTAEKQSKVLDNDSTLP